MAGAKEKAQSIVAEIFPTERMDELLGAIVKNVLGTHENGDFDNIGHHAIVAMISVDKIGVDKTKIKYDVMTIPSEGLIAEMYEFAGYVGSATAHMAPDRILVAAWLIGEGWMVETNEAMPTKVTPSEHPDREEIILVTGVSLDERRNHAIFRYSRNEGNRIIVSAGDVEVINVDAKSQAYSRNTTHMLQEYYKVSVPIMVRAEKK